MIRLLAVLTFSLAGYRVARGDWALAALDLVAAGVLVTVLWIFPSTRRWRSVNGRWPKRWEREQLRRLRGER